MEKVLDLLGQNTIRIKSAAKTREEAIAEAGELLILSGSVESRYVDAMQRSIVENGPYMVIVPGVAILHARPEDGVHQVCMSLVTLQEGVVFGHKDNDPVYLAIAFGAVDQYRHIEAISNLVRLLSDKQAVAAIITADSVQQVLRILHRVLATYEGGGDES
jgi:mannitol operon transcriptional antiterminator